MTFLLDSVRMCHCRHVLKFPSSLYSTPSYRLSESGRWQILTLTVWIPWELDRAQDVGITSRLGIGRPCRDKILLPSQKRPDHLWGSPNPPHSPPFNAYRGSLLSKRDRVLKLAIHIHFLQRVRMCGVIPLLPYVPSRRWQAQIYLFTFFRDATAALGPRSPHWWGF